MSQDAELLKLAFAYAGAVGKLSGTMRVLIDHGDAYTEQEKIAMMLESLIDADKQIDNASK